MILRLVTSNERILTSNEQRVKSYASFKGTLMQIWKSPHMFVFTEKQYPEKFAVLIPRVFELFTAKFTKCLFINIQKQRIRWKVVYFFKKIQPSRENNSRILRIINEKFSGYYELEQIGRHLKSALVYL